MWLRNKLSRAILDQGCRFLTKNAHRSSARYAIQHKDFFDSVFAELRGQYEFALLHMVGSRRRDSTQPTAYIEMKQKADKGAAIARAFGPRSRKDQTGKRHRRAGLGRKCLAVMEMMTLHTVEQVNQ